MKSEKPKKEVKSISSKTRECKTFKLLKDNKTCNWVFDNGEVCGKTFSKPCHLRAHMMIHEDLRPFGCSLCNQAFRQNSALNQHIRSVHEGERTFKCKMCEKTFFDKSKMICHMESVHEGKKAFKCGICDYSCYQNSYLKKHFESVHEGKKRFKCEMCGKSFYRKDKIIKHIASVHENVKCVTKPLLIKAI